MQPTSPRNHALWMITPHCPSRCIYCGVLEHKGARSVSSELAEQITEQIVKGGFRDLILGGGEPLISPIFDDIVRSVAGRVRVSAFTGGIPGPLDRVVERIVGGLEQLVCSMDGPTAELNDQFRGRAGVTAQLLNTIDKVRRRAPHMRLGFNSVVSAQTLPTIPDVWPVIAPYDPAYWCLTLASDNFGISPEGCFLGEEAAASFYTQVAPVLARTAASAGVEFLVNPMPVPLLSRGIPIAEWDRLEPAVAEELAGHFGDIGRGDYNRAFSQAFACPLIGVDILIGADCEVYGCSQFPVLRRDLAIGNLRDDPLESILRSQAFDRFQSGFPHAICKRCCAPSNVESGALRRMFQQSGAQSVDDG